MIPLLVAASFPIATISFIAFKFILENCFDKRDAGSTVVYI